MLLTSITAKYRELNLIAFNGWVIIWRNDIAVSMVIFPRATVCNNLFNLQARQVADAWWSSIVFLFFLTVVLFIPKKFNSLCYFQFLAISE